MHDIIVVTIVIDIKFGTKLFFFKKFNKASMLNAIGHVNRHNSIM